MSKDTIRLGDLCTIVMGQSPDSSSYNTSGHGMPFFQGNADFGRVSPTAKTWCTDPKKTASAGDLLISVRAPIGALNIADQECCIGRGLSAIRPDSHLASSRFLWHFLAHIRPQIEARGTGSTFKAINKSSLGDIPVPVYPIQEQEAIAEKLDVVSQVIASLSETRRQLDSLVKSKFVEMFGNDSNHVSVRDCCGNIVGGCTPSMGDPAYYGGNVPFIKSGDVKTTYLDRGTLWLTDKALRETNVRLLPKDTVIVVTRSGILRHTLPVAIASVPLAINQDLKGLMVDNQYSPIYIMWAIRLNSFKLLSRVRAVTADNIATKDLLALQIPNPPLALQEEFARFAEQADKSRFAIKQVIEKLGTLKGSLMQRYFG